MSYLSDFLKDGPATLFGTSGVDAIARNDLLQLVDDGNLYPCKRTEYAAQASRGSTPALIANVAVSGFPAIGSNRGALIADPVNGYVYAVTGYITADDGCRVTRYNSLLTGPITVNLDVTSTATTVEPQIVLLSNGNYVVVWGVTGGSIKFAIIDANLQVIIAATNIDTLDAATKAFSVSALSGGGFVVAYSKTNPWAAIYTNAGAVTLAASALTNAAAFGVAVNIRCAQLSSGDIAYAIGSGTAAKLLGFAITSAAGVSVTAVTMLNTGGAAAQNDVRISVMTGFFAVSNNNTGNQAVYVKNNAGATQGAAFTAAVATTRFSKLTNDGTQFWFFYPKASNQVANGVYVPTTGVGYVTTDLQTLGTTSTADDCAVFDAFCEHGYIMFVGSGTTYTLKSTAGALSIVSTALFNSSGTASLWGARPVGDFCVVVLDASATLSLYKYMFTAVMGVSQQAVAINTPGTIVRARSSGDMQCNALLGAHGKAFDFSSSTGIVGNKGTMFPNSVGLTGV